MRRDREQGLIDQKVGNLWMEWAVGLLTVEDEDDMRGGEREARPQERVPNKGSSKAHSTEGSAGKLRLR